jgi:hypothetical protein
VVQGGGRCSAPTLIQGGCFKLGRKGKPTNGGRNQKWRCNKRDIVNPETKRKVTCGGRVTQVDDELFIDAPHTCKPDPTLRVSIPLYAKAKQSVRDALFEPAPQLVDPIAHDTYKALSKRNRRNLPKMNNLLRAANRASQTSTKNPNRSQF